MPDFLSTIATEFGLPVYLVFIVVAWSLVWKALALWKSARKNHPVWFIIILVIQTLGIVEILYIFLFSKIKLPELENKKSRKKKKQRRK